MNAFTVQGSMHNRRRGEDGAARCWAIARRSLWGLSLAIVCQAAFAQAMYRIQPLTFPGGCPTSSPDGLSPEAYSLNNAGQVTGGACNTQGQEHAFLRQPGGARTAPPGTATRRSPGAENMVIP